MSSDPVPTALRLEPCTTCGHARAFHACYAFACEEIGCACRSFERKGRRAPGEKPLRATFVGGLLR